MIEETQAQRLDLFFKNQITQGLSPCFSIGLMDKEKSLYEFFDGFSAPEGYERWPINGNTQFNVGSVTKIVTGCLAIKLIEQGLLTLTTPVNSIISEYPFSDVTVYHLLTHTAGYEGIEEPWPHKDELDALFRKLYSFIERSYSPGERTVYFTNGYTILMDLIERVSGSSLEQFAQSVLFEPLAMKHTTFETEKLRNDSFVLPWNYEAGSHLNHLQHAAVTGDSGLYSTTGDLLRFGSLFLHKERSNEKRVFSQVSIDFMLREVTGGKFSKTPIFWQRTDSDKYGCFGDLHSPSSVGHPGFSGCMLTIDPFYERIGVILTNSTRLHSDWRNYKTIWNMLMSL